MSSWTLWLILSLDAIPDIVCIFMVIFLSLVILFFAVVFAEDTFDKNHVVYKMGVNFLKKLAIITSISVFIATVTPSTQEAFVIYGVPKLTQNQYLSETGRKLLTFTKLYLKVKTKELKGEKQK